MAHVNIIEQMSQEATMTEAAIVLLDAVEGAPVTETELMDAIRGLGEDAQKALTRTKWKDGIDIKVPTVDAYNFARWLIAARRAKLARAEEQA